MHTVKTNPSFAIKTGCSAGFILMGIINSIAGNTKSAEPDCLILISDDQRWDQVCYPGNQIIPELKTPKLDKLASQGVFFTNVFITTPIRVLSMAFIVTGRYASFHGMNHFNTPLGEEALLNTYPALLKKAGYNSGIRGKRGSAMAGTEILVDAGNAWAEQGAYFLDSESGKVHNPEWLAITREFLRSVQPGQPLCLTACYKAPHHPYQPDFRNSASLKKVKIPKRKSDTKETWSGIPERYKGKLLRQLMLNINIAPAIPDLAGIKVPPLMSGKNVVPVINHPDSGFRNDLFMEQVGIMKADYPNPDSYGNRTKEWNLIRYINIYLETDELYNLSEDPLEIKNLIDNKNILDVKNDPGKKLNHCLSTDCKPAFK